MEIYIIRGENPLDHEGSADVFGVFVDEELAKETLVKLQAQEETDQRKRWGERWRSFANYFEVETHEVILTSQQAVEEYGFKENEDSNDSKS